jgi:hypothetical protein
MSSVSLWAQEYHLKDSVQEFACWISNSSELSNLTSHNPPPHFTRASQGIRNLTNYTYCLRSFVQPNVNDYIIGIGILARIPPSGARLCTAYTRIGERAQSSRLLQLLPIRSVLTPPLLELPSAMTARRIPPGAWDPLARAFVCRESWVCHFGNVTVSVDRGDVRAVGATSVRHIRPGRCQR